MALELRNFVAKLPVPRRLDRADYDLHRLRHTRGVELALAGCSDAEGDAMMRHGARGVSRQYGGQAARSRLGCRGGAHGGTP